MYVLSAKLTFNIPCAQSLKNKRQVSRSLVQKVRQRYNVAVAEVDTQDSHQTLSLGIAVVSGEYSNAQKLLDEVIRFMELHEEAEFRAVEMF